MEVQENTFQKTINYFQFKNIESNRPVDQKHVNELIVKIQQKNLLHLFPIVVNSMMEIIDGQHRLAAAEQLKVYIYYQVDDQISKSDIANMNAVSKNWSIYDYINYWTVEKAEGFDKLSTFMIDNPLMPPSTVLQLLGKSQKRDVTALKKGIIDVTNYDKAQNLANVIREYHDFVPFAWERNFVLSVMNCFNNPEYDHEIMQRKLEFQKRRIVKCVTIKEYMEMWDEIYSYGSSKNRINLK